MSYARPLLLLMLVAGCRSVSTASTPTLTAAEVPVGSESPVARSTMGPPSALWRAPPDTPSAWTAPPLMAQAADAGMDAGPSADLIGHRAYDPSLVRSTAVITVDSDLSNTLER
jgi:hypothetical protein